MVRAMARGSARWSAIATFAALWAGLVPSAARADGPFEGDWRAGSMRIDVSVETWGGDCGPRPQSTSTGSGGTIRVTQSGDHLTFATRPQRTTRGCWSENTAVRMVSSTYQSGTWRIVCRTPPDDPRSETGTYTLTADGTERIQFRDVSRYDWQLNESHCIATITSTQTFERVSTATSEPTEPPPPDRTETPPETVREPACTPGAPARISMRPADAQIEPGGRQCFAARVVDARGCAVPGQSVALELRSPPGAQGALRGSCFEAGATAATAEGEFVVSARAGALSAEARVRVRTPDLSDLIARRSEAGGIVGGSGDAQTEAEARVAARAEGTTSTGSLVLPLVGGGIGLLLVGGAIIALLLRSRARRKRLDAEDEAARNAPSARPIPASAAPIAPPVEPPPMVPMKCPSCGRDHPPGATVCSQDGTALVPASALVAATSTAQGMICPTCHRGYGAGERVCPRDGSALVLYAEFTSRAKQVAGPTKVCPKCGERYSGATTFCGKDGTTLTPIA